tara:strand:- start:5649 stop:6494 length:846 start_codon:yes stop_codon:yes gene_type:complete
MEYRKGYTIKPKEISQSGEVTFTDGTNDVVANQAVCEAYGYTYNRESATCNAFKYSTRINENTNISTNIIGGAKNTLERGSDNILVVGEKNLTKGESRNVFMLGAENEVESGVNNSSILGGSYGLLQNQGEIVMAGGGYNAILGSAQTSFIQQSGNTEDDTETLLYTQFITNKFIEKVANSVMGFEIHIVGVNTGVGVGTAGDYGYIQVLGAVTFSNGLASTYHQHQNYLVNSGTSGLHLNARMKDATATSFGVAVTGSTETYIQWTASIRLWTNKIQQTI